MIKFLLSLQTTVASLLLLTLTAAAQGGGQTALADTTLRRINKARDKNKSEDVKPLRPTDTEISTRNIKFGVGFGGGYSCSTYYTYKLVAPKYALSRDEVSRLYGGVSGIVAYNKTVFYRKVVNGKVVGEPYARPYPVSALLALNLVDFTSKGVGFNTPIDLGLGIGVRFGDGFQIGAFMELSRQRYLRDAYAAYLGNPIPDFQINQTLTALDPNDENYFKSNTVVGFSIRFVYLFADDKPKAKDLTNRLPEGQAVTAP